MRFFHIGKKKIVVFADILLFNDVVSERCVEQCQCVEESQSTGVERPALKRVSQRYRSVKVRSSEKICRRSQVQHR